MKSWFRSRWFWLALIFLIVLFGGVLFVEQDATNIMHPALDKLASLSLSERWSHPEMLKIRVLGTKAVPPLRRVLREKDSPTTRFLMWVKLKWPGAAKYYSHFPDSSKMTERRWTACQVLQTLGPAGKSAAPELIKVIQSKDPLDVNGGAMALWAVGIDSNVCEQLDEVLENGTSGFGRVHIVNALGKVKPPSARTLNALLIALSDTSPYVQQRAAETLGSLGVATPTVISRLKNLLSGSSDDLLVVTSSEALWELQKDPGSVTGRVFQVLAHRLELPLPPPIGGGNGGQGVDATEQIFMKGADLFRSMASGEDKARALALLEAFCAKSGRIFIRMLLLPAMMDLGLPREKCFEVCSTGLKQQEDYYRIQAAQLLVQVSDRYPVNEINLDALIRDPEVGVRVYSAMILWRKNRQANAVVPVLMDALNRPKHQSYYYDMQILPAALSALAEIGPEAHEAAAELDALTREPNPVVAKLAAEALFRIRR